MITLGWDGMFMRPHINALLEPNPWQDPTNPGAVHLIKEISWLLRQNLNNITNYGKL